VTPEDNDTSRALTKAAADKRAELSKLDGAVRAIRSASSARSASDEGMVKSGYRPALELMTS